MTVIIHYSQGGCNPTMYFAVTQFTINSSSEIVGTTMMNALRKVLTKSECEIMKDTGRTLFEQGIRGKTQYSGDMNIKLI